MKYFLIILSFTVSLSTIAQSKNSNGKSNAYNVMIGTWVGEMSGKKLTIVIEKVEDKKLSGYNLLGSTKRSVKGTFNQAAWDESCSIAFDAILSEPGDDKWDGVFTVQFFGNNEIPSKEDAPECEGDYKGTHATGKWKSNNKKLNKEFSLTKVN